MAIQTHGFVPENECTVHYRLQFLFLGNIKCRSRACAPMTDAPTACFHEQCDGTSRSNIYIHQQTSSENTLAAECKDTFRLQASLLKLNVQCTTVLRKYKMPAEQQCTCSDDRFNADRGEWWALGENQIQTEFNIPATVNCIPNHLHLINL